MNFRVEVHINRRLHPMASFVNLTDLKHSGSGGKMLRKIYLTLVISLLVFVPAGCSRQSGPALPEPVMQDRPASEIIRIGSVMPETGVIAPYGRTLLDAIELAFDEINSAGGVLGKTLVLINKDNQSKAEETAAAFRELIENEMVVAIIGPAISSHALMGVHVAQEAGIPVISPASFDPAVTLVGDYIFRACFTDPFQGRIMANFTLRELGLSTAAILVEQESRYARSLAECFRECFEAGGGKVVLEEAFSNSEKDFNSLLSKVSAAGPEFIYIPSFYDVAGPILRQARDIGFATRFGGGDGWDFPELFKLAGEAADGGYFTRHYSPEVDSPAVKAFVAAFQARCNKTPDTMAALAYDAAYLLAHAIEEAGSTAGHAIRDALAAISFTGVCGFMTFDENRNPVKDGIIIGIEGQKHVYRATVRP
jgi:branched-chain amino acid transport system substrate-binding protein